jgi:hypothetical protein
VLKHGTSRFNRCTAQLLPAAFARLSVRLARLNADPARLLTQASAIANANRSGLLRGCGGVPATLLVVRRSGSRDRACPSVTVEEARAIIVERTKNGAILRLWLQFDFHDYVPWIET